MQSLAVVKTSIAVILAGFFIAGVENYCCDGESLKVNVYLSRGQQHSTWEGRNGDRMCRR